MQLIVKADDFGSTPGVTDGIIKAMKEGVVRDTSMLVNSPHFDYAASQAKKHGIEGVGLHLTLTYRSPILPPEEIPSLVTEEGKFHHRANQIPHDFSIDEVEAEFRAQIEKFQSSGLEMTHIDSHHHIHRNMGDDVLNLVLKLAEELHVPIRRPEDRDMHHMMYYDVKTTDFFSMEFGGLPDNSTTDRFIEVLSEFEGCSGSLEIMCHPAIVDEELLELSTWGHGRQYELEALTDPDVLGYISDHGIELVSFAAIKHS